MARYAAVLLLLLAAGCATAAPVPPVSEPPVVAPQAATPQPVATPVAPAKTAPAKPVATPAAPRVAAPRAPATPPVAAATPPAAPLDLHALEAQLRATKAIGLFTKISLKNQVDDLMKQFRDHYGGKTTRTMTELRRSYDLLIMKVLSLLQDDDRQLASAIVSSREAIWGLLSDQNKFANL
jgi:hypothetical protein